MVCVEQVSVVWCSQGVVCGVELCSVCTKDFGVVCIELCTAVWCGAQCMCSVGF